MTVELSVPDLREVTRFAAECAQGVLAIFEGAHPADSRPRAAIDAAWAFARGGARGKALRDTGWAAHKAAREAGTAAAGDAARAAMYAASAAYLHPLPDAHQVKHILGAAAHAARATELVVGNDQAAGAAHLERARLHATPLLVEILRRYPAAPAGGARVGELMRDLDSTLRVSSRFEPAENFRGDTVAQPVVHFEIIGTDPQRLREYFGALFGWEFDTPSPVAPEVSDPDSYGFLDLVSAADGTGIRGGVGGGPGYASHAVFYVGVPNVEAALQRAEDLGGTRVMGPATAPSGLVIGHFTDPEGTLIGVAGVA